MTAPREDDRVLSEEDLSEWRTWGEASRAARFGEAVAKIEALRARLAESEAWVERWKREFGKQADRVVEVEAERDRLREAHGETNREVLRMDAELKQTTGERDRLREEQAVVCFYLDGVADGRKVYVREKDQPAMDSFLREAWEALDAQGGEDE